MKKRVLCVRRLTAVSLAFALLGMISLVSRCEAALIDTWEASTLTNSIATGSSVNSWVSQGSRSADLVSGTTAPTLVTGATPGGAPVVRFNGAGRLAVPGASSPAGGRTTFSVAIVFKANSASANDNAQWWGKTGIVDAEQPGATADWGTAIDQTGNVGIGIGNGDNSLYSSAGSLVDGRYHVAVFTWGGGTTRVFVDNFQPSTATGVPTAARNASTLSFGGIQTGEANRRFNGDLAEIEFLDTALSQAEATNLIAQLASKYGIAFPQLINSFTISTNVVSAGQSVTLNWNVAANATVRLTPGPGDVTSQTVNGAGSITLTPTNDTTYSLTASNASGARTLTVSVVVNRTAASSLIDVWDAATLASVGNSNIVTTWLSLSNRAANSATAVQPVFIAAATPAGTPVVRFTNSILRTSSADTPVGGLNEFTLAYVFKVNAQPTANSDAQWWGQTGIVDAEQPGATADWGSSVNINGQVGLGIGQPDVTDYSQGLTLVDPLYHVAVFTWGQGKLTTWVDNRAPVIVTNVPTAARNVSPVAFGGIQVLSNPLSGDLAEVRFYNDALIPAEATNVLSLLVSKHGLFFPNVLLSFTANPQVIEAGQSSTLSWQAEPGVTLTIDQGIGNVDGNTVNGAGSISVTPANDTTYTLTGTNTNGLVRTRSVTVIVNRTAASTQLDIWDAVDLSFSLIDGDAVNQWTSQGGRVAAVSAASAAPTFVENATPAGTPAVKFTNSILKVTANNPVQGLTEFAVAYVFKIDAQPFANDSAAWWGKTGVVDAEEPSSAADWGTALDENGHLGFGAGPTDMTIYSGDGSLFDGFYHVAVATWGSGVMRLFIDDQPPVVTTTNVATGARDNGDLAFGGITSGQTNRMFSGRIAEIRFYADALSSNEVETVISALKTKHGAGAPLQPRILSITLDANKKPVIRWSAVPGTTYSVRRKTNLNDPDWTVIDTRVATQTEEVFTDTLATADQGYYQVIAP